MGGLKYIKIPILQVGLIFLLSLCCSYCVIADSKFIDDTVSVVPAYSIRINNPEGKTVTIDFSGDKIKINGDLPIEEAAKIFFENVHGLCNKCGKTNEFKKR